MEQAIVPKQKKLYILNAFSLSMVDNVLLDISRISPVTATGLLKNADKMGFTVVSAVGHESTAKLLSRILGIEVPVNRVQIKMEDGDWAIVLQLLVRLEEGRVLNEQELQQLLEQGKIVLYLVRVMSKSFEYS